MKIWQILLWIEIINSSSCIGNIYSLLIVTLLLLITGAVYILAIHHMIYNSSSYIGKNRTSNIGNIIPFLIVAVILVLIGTVVLIMLFLLTNFIRQYFASLQFKESKSLLDGQSILQVLTLRIDTTIMYNFPPRKQCPFFYIYPPRETSFYIL